MNNAWNRFIYRLWTPFYNQFFNTGKFLEARKRVFSNVHFKPKETILFNGVGTGADLKYLPSFPVEVYAIDLSKEMLAKSKRTYPKRNITFIEMDAQALTFKDNTFDKIIANLILSVVPSPEKALKEMVRVLKPGGQIIIFDKFVHKGNRLSVGKKLLVPVIQLLGTDINVSFENLMTHLTNDCLIKRDVPLLFNGIYRYIIIEKMKANIH
jgi:phosphatidylethanolamine/phosphatidyl-N-methylethanolamine N-methyltransferase